MNPESLDSSIQSALSALYPPFEATAPIILSQLFRTIEERYHGDALQCLLDFLIPSKHLLESVQQAACAGYSDVVFRCEGWPLCLHDKTVVQLAPVNPLLLRPGDFYLQVEPFGDQAARIVLKSLLEVGCREVEETPISETSYSCIFTEDWLREINDGRHGTPLSRCLLCTDQGVIKLPWAEVAIPEFLDKPKFMTTHQEVPPEPKLMSVPCTYGASTLPLEARVLQLKDKTSASLIPGDCSSKLVKLQHYKGIPRSYSKPLIKPVGWVSPNSWDSRNHPEIEGDYVDLVDVAKGTDFVTKHGSHSDPPNAALVKPVRPPPSAPVANNVFCGRTLQYAEEPCLPCRQGNQSEEDISFKCRYRDSYLAAQTNPVPFEKSSVDLAALEEVSLSEDLDQNNELGQFCIHCNTPMSRQDFCQYRHSYEPTTQISGCTHKNIPATLDSEDILKESPVILTSTPGSSYSHKVQMKFLSQSEHMEQPMLPCNTSDDWDKNPHQNVDVMKSSAKHKSKSRSLSTVSDTPKGSPLFSKHNNRSHSDICPETVSSVMQCKKADLPHQVPPQLERLKSYKKDSQPGGSEPPSTSDGLDMSLQDSKTDDKSSSELPSVSFTLPQSFQSLKSTFKSISGLLELAIIYLPGSRDKTGRAVVEILCDKECTTPPLSAQNLCQLLLYLHSIPRKDVRELGMTLIIDARKKPPPPHLYKALLMAQEQALHAVHSIIMLVDKDTCPRPEKQPGLQMDLVTSMKSLYKTVDASQLTNELGGTFSYCHKDWLQFHQRLVSFITDLQEADSLLQKAITKVNESNVMDTAQEVHQCIQEQRDLMKEVLEDTRLVTLQREGGAVLARMRREEFRFPQSEDYRDALESVTHLYNQVEEKLHMLVMRSNESFQQLEFLFVLRDMDAKIKESAVWFCEDGENRLKEFDTKDDNVYTEDILQRFDTFFLLAKGKQQYASTLANEAEKHVGTSVSSPVTDVFLTLLNTFKRNVDDFMERVQQMHKELETLVKVHHFCDQASALAKECSHFLDQVESGCYLPQTTLSTLQMYEDRLGDEFSTRHFQALKSKACSLRSGSSSAMSMWNVAWAHCQEVKQHLEKMQKKMVCRDKKQNQQTTAERTRGEAGEMEIKPDMREVEWSLTLQPTYQNYVVHMPENEHTTAASSPLKRNGEIEPEALELLPLRNGETPTHPDIKWKSRGHHSEVDLSRTALVQGDANVPRYQVLGRSMSEGSCITTHVPFAIGGSPFNVRQPLCQRNKQLLEQNLDPLQNLSAPHIERLSFKSRDGNEECPTKEHTASTQISEDIKETLIISKENNGSNILKLRKIMEELLSTEREYVNALGYVREHYFPELERNDVPQHLRGQKGSIFGNLEKLHDFHRHHFLSELENCVNEPFRVGRSFLRHRENFALYALYSKNKPQSDSLLINHGKTFFKQKQLNLRDKMDLWSYLLKPVQRISKYSLLLQDMMRECAPGQVRELAELKNALEVIHFQLRHGNNLLAMDAIHQCDVNLKEQGQLIRQDEFSVTFRKKKCSRHIFLFQELILFSKTRKTDVGNDTYVYKQSFKTSDVGMTQNTGDTGLCFEIWFRKRKTQDTYTLQAVSREVKEAWTKDLERILWDQALHNREVRMQERVFMGIGNKPFMDIQPSDAAISDRAVDCGLMARESKVFPYVAPNGPHNGLPGARPKSAGSRSTSSSSSSSGLGSLPPTVYSSGPKRKELTSAFEGYISPVGVLEEDDMDRESGSHNLLLDSSESSGDSVSGLSSSAHSCRSALEREAEDASSVCTATIAVGEVAESSQTGACEFSEQCQATVPPRVKSPLSPQNLNGGKSTEV